jgi:putative nucleotidyltransferase with HDIG domain
VITVTNGRAALACIEKSVPDLVLLDIVMPGLDGYEVCRRLKADERTMDVPVIFVSAVEDPVEQAKAFKMGAADFITKPIPVVELKARVTHQLAHKQTRDALRRQNLLLEEIVNERTRKLQDILDMALLINGERDIDRLFHLIVTQVSRVMDCDRSSLFILDPEKDEFWTKAAEGISGAISIPRGKGLVGKVAETEKPLIVEDAWSAKEFDTEWDQKHGYRTRSVLGHPVRNRKGDLIGVLEAINKKKGTFRQGDEALAAALAAHVGVALETDDLLKELENAFESFAGTLSRAVEAKHPLTAGHSLRVTEYSLLLGRKLGLTEGELEILKYACLLHDIGKIGVPDRVLTKKGRFDSDEKVLMNDHAKWTFLILREIRLPRNLKEVPQIAACHHEKVDGSGYPFGLSGEEIPFFSRIMAVADVFDALTSRRDYAKYDGSTVFSFDPLPLDKAFEILERDQSSHFDPQVSATALKAREELSASCESANRSLSGFKPGDTLDYSAP